MRKNNVGGTLTTPEKKRDKQNFPAKPGGQRQVEELQFVTAIK